MLDTVSLAKDPWNGPRGDPTTDNFSKLMQISTILITLSPTEKYTFHS